MVALREIFESLGAADYPRVDRAARARERNNASLELGRILEADFSDAVDALAAGDRQPADRRALVRCFGSLIDGLAHALRTIAEVACSSQGRQHSILQEKSEPCILQRICVSYRMISRGLPKSPLTSLQAKRWDELKACLDIRNRVLHPETPSDLEITDANLRLVTEVARQFIHDFQTLVQWQAASQPRLREGSGGRTRRKKHRAGRRFRQCPCGSQRKYKNCCAVAQKAA